MKWIACVLLGCCICVGQQLVKRMTNQDVIDMVSLGLPDDVIIEKIRLAAGFDFDTSVPGLRTLKAAKVSDSVIRLMVNPRLTNNTPPLRAARVTPPNATSSPQEVGVYMVRDGRLTAVQPEIVNWQTGGVLKTFASLGLVKGDVNGKVMGGRSPTRATSDLSFLVKTPEGTSVEEYQLLRLHSKSNRREFRSVTGGILHVSGGAQRDEVPFQPEKVGDRLWKIDIHGLARGEYGFLPPGVASASISASGKMYTFDVHDEGGTRASRDRLENAESSDTSTPTQEVLSEQTDQGTIGVSFDGNPTVRHDGVTLSRVLSGGPADQAGIKSGDVVLAIDNHYLFTAQDMNVEVSRRRPGTRITVRYRRYSAIYEASVVVGLAE